MKLAHLGETRLIAALTRRLPRGPDVRVGVGDDCAVIGSARAARWALLKTDAVVEGVHFRSDEDLRRVGWKALCRAISDIAAMGGTPEHALVTLAISREAKLEDMQALYSGLRAAARQFHVAIVGGETSRSPGPLFISIALTGSVERVRCTTRAGGRPGDFLYVTGRLGGSGTGKHLSFTPRVIEARWLVSHVKVRAMMDISDGLAADLPRLADASACDYELEESRIPRSPGCTLGQALTDGEDFELLFAVAPRHASKLERAWRKKFSRLPLTRVGKLITKSAGKLRPVRARGFDHFA